MDKVVNTNRHSRGMSSALGGAGGGGLLNTTQSTNANVAVYASKSLPPSNRDAR